MSSPEVFLGAVQEIHQQQKAPALITGFPGCVGGMTKKKISYSLIVLRHGETDSLFSAYTNQGSFRSNAGKVFSSSDEKWCFLPKKSISQRSCAPRLLTALGKDAERQRPLVLCSQLLESASLRHEGSQTTGYKYRDNKRPCENYLAT